MMEQAANIQTGNMVLSIVNDPDKEGDHWRILNLGNPTSPFADPHTEEDQTVTWEATDDKITEVQILFLDQSPLDPPQVKKGKGNLGDYKLKKPPAKNTKYEYVAIVKTKDKKTHYVSGENSPPGIIVDPHNPNTP